MAERLMTMNEGYGVQMGPARTPQTIPPEGGPMVG